MIDGLHADVVTLALADDIDAIAERGLLAPNWQTRLPDNAAPYTSTIVFLVRKGNPKHIQDWADLLKPGVSVITPNPKTSGGARWNFLAAWGYALQQPGGDDAIGRDFVRRAVPPCAGARHRRARLDHHLRPARHRRRAAGLGERGVSGAGTNSAQDKFEIVYPPLSILAEPPVAVVDSVVDQQGHARRRRRPICNSSTARGAGDRGKNYYRPRNPEVCAKYAERFPQIKMVTIDDVRRLGRRRRRPTSPTAACSTRSTQPGTMTGRYRSPMAARSPRRFQRRCPGFGSALGVTLVWVSPDRPAAAGGAGAAAVGARPRRRLAFADRTARAGRAAAELRRRRRSPP